MSSRRAFSREAEMSGQLSASTRDILADLNPTRVGPKRATILHEASKVNYMNSWSDMSSHVKVAMQTS